MSESTKNVRTAYYKQQNFGGTTDWAVDLGSFTKSELSYTSPTIFQEIERGGKCIWRTRDGMDCLRKGATDSTTMTRKGRWWDLGAPCAWRELRANWTNQEDTKLRFSVWVSDNLDGSENMQCHIIAGLAEKNTCESGSFLCDNTRDARLLYDDQKAIPPTRNLAQDDIILLTLVVQPLGADAETRIGQAKARRFVTGFLSSMICLSRSWT
jgi:hypothetical protein